MVTVLLTWRTCQRARRAGIRLGSTIPGYHFWDSQSSVITATGLGDHTWLLMGVGGLGIIQNPVVPKGFPSILWACVGTNPACRHCIGRVLRDEFFSAELRGDEVRRWNILARESPERLVSSCRCPLQNGDDEILIC